LRAILNIDPRILATSLALLVIALVLLARRRVMVARIRREREAELAAQASDGETSVLPLAHLASAVEVLDLDDLLAGEEGSVAAAARRQLEEPTNVSTAPDTFFPLPSVPASRPAAAAAVLQMAAAVAPAVAVAVADRRPAASAMMPAEAGAAAAERVVPVRELALAWFEARGYRPSNASQAVRPIELVLRHRKDPARAYAFIVEMERVNAERATALVNHAHSIGLTRVLVAAEGGIEPGTRHRFRRQGVRLVDQDEMRREFDKLDLRVAAKIIAVARSRARLRKEAR
jgi:hypothetical protein